MCKKSLPRTEPIYPHKRLLLLALEVSTVLIQLSSQNLVKQDYLQFSNQTDDSLDKATDFAILKSGTSGGVPSDQFTICGSIYIGYFRQSQAFYTVRRNDHVNLWLSLMIWSQEPVDQSYNVLIYVFEENYFSNTGGFVRMRPFAWSHACTTVDLVSGQVTNAVNGVLTHELNIRNKDFLDNVPEVFENNLVLGVVQWQSPGSPTVNKQSEASVTNLNIYSDPMSIAQTIALTTTERCLPGDILHWDRAQWDLVGTVGTQATESFCSPQSFPHLFPLTTSFHQQSDCIALCPRLQPGGRLPFAKNWSSAKDLFQQLRQANPPGFVYTAGIWSSFIHKSDGQFIDFHNRHKISPDLWVPGQPNDGEAQPCTSWWDYSSDGRLYDDICSYPVTTQFQCLCQFRKPPILRLRGLCRSSKIDTYYTLKYVDGSIVYKGLTNSQIRFSSVDSFKWTISVNRHKTQGIALANEKSYIIGRHVWNISDDSFDCENGAPYARVLKMSGCSESQFTCDNGFCLRMEERCDQVLDCDDHSDEADCNILQLPSSYRKTAPPLRPEWEDQTWEKRTVMPVEVTVTLTLLDISAIREAQNEIDIKFTAKFEWMEFRARFFNLKEKLSRNNLEQSESAQLWIPNLIYRNNKDNDDTRSEITNSKFQVKRQGNFTRSTLNTVDDIDIFTGNENPIFMIQSYTKEFRCRYNLRVFPFDTQVYRKVKRLIDVTIFRCVK